MATCAGADPNRAADGARRLLECGCSALLSFGVAGALDPALRVGEVIVPEAIISPFGDRLPTDDGWRQRLLSYLDTARSVPVAGSDVALLNRTQKAEVRRRTGAAAVDMESHAVARVAQAGGVPMLAVRAVSDPFHRSMPAWIAATVADDGTERPWVVASQVLRRPWQIPGLIRLGLDFEAALRSLRRVVADARPLFQVFR